MYNFAPALKTDKYGDVQSIANRVGYNVLKYIDTVKVRDSEYLIFICPIENKYYYEINICYINNKSASTTDGYKI